MRALFYLGGRERDAHSDLAVVRVVGGDDAVLGRVLLRRAALHAKGDQIRHIDPASHNKMSAIFFLLLTC